MSSELPLVGNHFIIGLDSDKLSVKEGKLLTALKPAGVILFKQNLPSKLDNEGVSRIRTLLQNAQDASERDLFISTIDHEGGDIVRFTEGTTNFPPPAKWGGYCTDIAKVLASELKFLGFNLDLAPVADVLLEQECSVIGARAFSSKPEKVAQSVNEFLAGFEEVGIMGCLKHFPGHGHVKDDSHLTLPISKKSVNELMDTDLVPFVQCKADLIMTAHILFEKIDPDLPASLSKKVINGLLRETLGYENAVVTDALEMKALDQYRENSAELIIDSGTDFVLIGQSSDILPVEVGLRHASKMLKKVDKSASFESALLKARKRTEALLEKLSFSPLDIPRVVNQTSALRKAESLEIEKEVYNA